MSTPGSVILRFSLFLALAMVILSACKRQKKEVLDINLTFDNDTIMLKEMIEKRESITFIMGEDHDMNNPYYTEANYYYRSHKGNQTDHIVLYCRSFLEVRDHLAENTSADGLPWGLINIVTHGNQWLGLSIPVLPGSKRATSESINSCIKDSSFLELHDSIIDNKSEIFIHGCGIGNNHSLLKAIGRAFGGLINKPAVRSSRLFEYYTSTRTNGVLKSQRYLAKVWYTTYKKGYRPENNTLNRKLNKKYPSENVNWNDALSREYPRWPGDYYHYTFEVPVKWVFTFPDTNSLPDISTKTKELEWIKGQKEIMEGLDKINIPVEKFNWWFRKVYVNNDDGTRSPAIWLKGYCTVLCILKPLLEDESKDKVVYEPLKPELSDTNYYWTENSSM